MPLDLSGFTVVEFGSGYNRDDVNPRASTWHIARGYGVGQDETWLTICGRTMSFRKILQSKVGELVERWNELSKTVGRKGRHKLEFGRRCRVCEREMYRQQGDKGRRRAKMDEGVF